MVLLARFTLLRKRMALRGRHAVYAYLSLSTFKLLKHLTHFHEKWNECRAIGGHPNAKHSNSLHSAISTWWRSEFSDVEATADSDTEFRMLKNAWQKLFDK
jgi:hypothetical protein